MAKIRARRTCSIMRWIASCGPFGVLTILATLVIPFVRGPLERRRRGVLAFFFGAPFLTAYMLYLSFSTNGNIQEMLMGPGRAAA